MKHNQGPTTRFKFYNNQITILINSLSQHIGKLDEDLKELNDYRTGLDNPVIKQALALETKRTSDLKADTSALCQMIQKIIQRTLLKTWLNLLITTIFVS